MIKKDRLEDQVQKAYQLKEAGHIKEFEIYQDSLELRLRFTNTEKIPIEIYGEIEMLLSILESPILFDNIEELVTNFERQKIRKTLFELDRDLYSFYETNKLQSSNMVGVLVLISMLNNLTVLPEPIMISWEEIRREFNGTPYLKLNAFWRRIFEKIRRVFHKPQYRDCINALRYKSKMKNKAKVLLVRKLTRLIELTLIEVLHKYGVE